MQSRDAEGASERKDEAGECALQSLPFLLHQPLCNDDAAGQGGSGGKRRRVRGNFVASLFALTEQREGAGAGECVLLGSALVCCVAVVGVCGSGLRRIGE